MGRGTQYTAGRHATEWLLDKLYRRGWPARLVHALGLQPALRVERHTVATPKWPAGVRPLRLAFASDLHAGPTTHPSLLDAAFRALADANADAILLGGDYVFLSADHIAEIARRVARLSPPLGIYGVLGNHDLWADDRAIVRALSDAGARILVDERVVLPAPFSHVALAGLDDPYTGSRRSVPPFPADDDGRVRIVLVHAPEVMLLIDPHPFELAICGHTHGGHIALPGGVPIVVPGPLSRRYAHGRHDVGEGRTLIVSKGVGATEVALRWNADPDVLVVEVGRFL